MKNENKEIQISIITATFNAEVCLRNLINSLLPQKSSNIELLIIDGKSTDGTLDIIKTYGSSIDYYISEPDNGIYDAWNKGVVKSRGNWIMFLGADDYLKPNAIEIYLSFLNQNINFKNLDLITSKRTMINLSGNKIREVGSIWIWPKCLKGMLISHPGALHNKNLFTQYGLFNTTFKIAGDYEFLLRAKSKLNAGFIDKTTVIVQEGGISDSILAIREHYRAVILHDPSYKFQTLIIDTVTALKYYLKKAFRIVGINAHL